MPATDYQGSSTPLLSLGRSLLSLRRDQISSMDAHPDYELESFQRRVAELFNDLAAVDNDGILSIHWIRKLLDAFLVIHEEFHVIMAFAAKNSTLSRPPLDRLVAEFFERCVKALDVCNAIRDGVDQVRSWEKNLEIVLVALGPGQRMLGEGQFRRAKKALAEYTIATLEEKEAGSVFSHRNRSFGRHGNSNKDHHRSPGHSRSLSWSVSRSWSAARQLQAIGNNLVAPRSNEVAATNGLAVPIFTMNSVLLFVMWALVAAIPCQDRGIQMHFAVPRSYVWAAPVMVLYERIMEESKKKDKRNTNGLLKEIHQIEKCVRCLSDLGDAIQFPMDEEKELEVKQGVQELGVVCAVLKNGLDPLECQVREVFRRIILSRTEGLDNMGQTAHH